MSTRSANTTDQSTPDPSTSREALETRADRSQDDGAPRAERRFGRRIDCESSRAPASQAAAHGRGVRRG